MEQCERQESSLPAVSIAVVGITELLQSVIFTNKQVGYGNNHFLTDAIGSVEAVTIDRDCDSRRFVLDNEVFVDITGSIRAYYTSLDNHAVAGFSELNGVDIVLIIFPVFALQLKDSGVHLIDMSCRRNCHRRAVEIVGATCRHSNCHKQQQIEIQLKMSHIRYINFLLFYSGLENIRILCPH